MAPPRFEPVTFAGTRDQPQVITTRPNSILWHSSPVDTCTSRPFNQRSDSPHLNSTVNAFYHLFYTQLAIQTSQPTNILGHSTCSAHIIQSKVQNLWYVCALLGSSPNKASFLSYSFNTSTLPNLIIKSLMPHWYDHQVTSWQLSIAKCPKNNQQSTGPWLAEKKEKLTRITATYIFGFALNFSAFLLVSRWFLEYRTTAPIQSSQIKKMAKNKKPLSNCSKIKLVRSQQLQMWATSFPRLNFIRQKKQNRSWQINAASMFPKMAGESLKRSKTQIASGIMSKYCKIRKMYARQLTPNRMNQIHSKCEMQVSHEVKIWQKKKTIFVH